MFILSDIMNPELVKEIINKKIRKKNLYICSISLASRLFKNAEISCERA